MTNLEFDDSLMTKEDIIFLKAIDRAGSTGHSARSWRLHARGMLKPSMPYRYPYGVSYREFQVSPRGSLFLRGVVPGNRIVISQSYHLPHMRGKVGTVLGFTDTKMDSDGFDEFGYQVRWAQDTFRVDVQLDEHSGTWCFYKTTDLEGFFSCQ